MRLLVVLVGVCSFSFGTPTLQAEDPKVQIAGYWDWTFGNVFLKTAIVKDKKHLAVTGWYLAGENAEGTITSGTYNPATGVLEYSFEEPWHPGLKGSARYVLSADGKQFKGHSEIADIKNDPIMTRVEGDTFEARVDSIIANTGIKANTPGAAVLVVEGGRAIVEKGYGLANLKNKKPITPTTTFELASCSKQITGTAILLLYERGLLKLEDDVRKYLPELPEYDKKNPVRIVDLARQTSGLPEYWDLEDVKGRNPRFRTIEDYLSEFARQRKQHPLLFTTGQKYDYKNTNYLFMALIVERITKKSFNSFLKSELFTPLGMNTAVVNEKLRMVIKEPAMGYLLEKDKFKEVWGPEYGEQPDLVYGAGGIWMSITDLVRWDAAWRRGKVLKPQTIDKWLALSKTRDGKDNDYAFGWWVTVEEGKLRRAMHSGGCPGICTFVDRNLASDRTIVVLCNWDAHDSNGIRTAIEHLCWAMPHKIFWRYGEGHFEYTGKNKWTEKAPTGETFHFVEARRTDNYVELSDKSRECTVRLTATECQVKFKDGKFEKYYHGKWENK
jgi:CubicO group peptidase (beta-lactamase class C family)